MKAALFGSILLFLTVPLQATDQWGFSERIAVTAQATEEVFHHLEGAGRKHIAVSAETIAITWEDDSSGDPQVYVSIKKTDSGKFTAPFQLSTGSEAYEPALAGLSADRFVLVWEQDGKVYARGLVGNELGEIVQLSTMPSAQASVAAWENDAYCVWREQRGRQWNLVVSRLVLDSDKRIQIQSTQQVESSDLDSPVLFPTISASASGINLAWEDRQEGHTRLKQSFSADQGKTFSPPQYLNEFHSNRNQYDKGSGVTRVSIATYGEDEVIAAWMDKRRGNTGYGIYTAFGSEDAFGPNEKAHGMKGDRLPHYNPSTAGNSNGDFVVAWDDYRNNDSDIWISSYTDDDEWSQDFSPPPASGKGEQTHASVTLDERGNMHMVWIERQSVDAASRLWYSIGIRK